MEHKIAILFPGQGSQFIGMGKEFADADKDAARFLEEAETWSGAPLRRLCFEGPTEELMLGGNLQPAITAVNLLAWQALDRAGIKAHFVAGHSLGEYSALAAAGVLTARDAISLTARRGAFMEREGQRQPGAMVAILGAVIDEVRDLLAEVCTQAQGTAVIANHNAEQQIVVAGDGDTLTRVQQGAAVKGWKAIPLKVTIANHSPLVAGAVPEFESVLAATTMTAPSIPVYFNVTAAPENDPAEIRKIMARQMISMVRWHEILLHLREAGANVFIEAGPKNVLTAMVKRAFPKGSCQAFQVDSPAKVAACVEELLRR